MKVITAYSHKGGTGKTTALMMLASAIQAKGQTAFLVDCDPHQSFAAYQAHSGDRWADGFDVAYMHYEATSLVDLETALVEAEDSGKYDYCLLNLAGVDHPFNQSCLRYAELTLLPFAPSALDLMELPGALEIIKDLAETGEVGAARVVLTKMKAKMDAAQKSYIETALKGFPMLETEIKDNSIFRDLVMRGLLGRSIEIYGPTATGLEKMEIQRMEAALDQCKDLLAEVDATIQAEEEAAA